MDEQVNVLWTVLLNMGLQTLLIVFVFYIIYRVGWESFLKYIEERQSIVTTVIVEAQHQKDDAQVLFVEAQVKLQNINDKTEDMLKKAEATSKMMVEAQARSLKLELDNKRLAADKQLEYERRRLTEEMQKQAVDMATKVASQFLESKASKEQTEMQIESFIEKMGEQ
ncbi:hypothetical protein AwErysi_04840 [Erysipelotrichaceae bacterium]|nr:hypothetical protein AwErysi_04840 [Erysipelotrichaceae bacterium]